MKFLDNNWQNNPLCDESNSERKKNLPDLFSTIFWDLTYVILDRLKIKGIDFFIGTAGILVLCQYTVIWIVE